MAPPLHLSAAGLAAAVVGPGLLTALVPITELEGRRGIGILFVVAVAVAAYVDGLWAGLLCAALSFVSYLYFFLPPTHSFDLGASGEGIFAGLVFLLATVVVAQLSERQRLFRLQAEEASAELTRSAARYRSLVEAAAQIIWLADERGLDGGLSAGWLEFTGQRPEDARGSGWLDCVHPDDREAVARQWQRSLAEGRPFEGEYRLRSASGDYRTMSVRAVPVRGDDRRILEWVGTATDVTEARAMDRLARVRARQQLEVADLGRLALTGISSPELLERALEVAVETLGADRAGALELLPAGDELVLRASHGWEGAPIGTATAPSDRSLAGYVLASDGPVVSEDVASDERFAASPLLRQTEATSAVAVVVRGRRRPWGVLGVFSKAPRRFSLDDASFVRAIANVLASAFERSAAEEAVRASEARLKLALEAGRLGTWDRDLRSASLSWSPAVEEAFGLEPGSFRGDEEAFRELVHPDDVDEVDRALAAALAGREPYDVEYRCVRPDGSVGWISSQGQVLRDAGGVPVRMVGLSRDVTERKRREELLAFLAESSEVLSGTLDYEHSLAEIARLAVPRLADCCIVDLVAAGGGVEQVAVVHADLERERRIAALEARYVTDAGERTFVGRLLASRSAKLVPRVDGDFLADVARDAEHLQGLRDLGLRSALYAPLVARGRVLGLVVLLMDTSGRTFGAEELAIAVDFARHAALAVDNGRLYQQRSHIASTLQRSLLPPVLPHVSGIELAARYRAAGSGLEVGGDFYDAFALGDDRYLIAIGDVCGKGPEAAAVTGLVRHTIRAASLLADAPSEVLARLNDVVFGEYDGSTFCTVVCGALDVAAPRTRLRLASGGHPLPLHLHAGGTAEPIGASGTLVGIFEDARFDEVEVELQAGDAVLLYTDGLAEGLAGQLEPGEQRLQTLLADCADRDAESIAARIDEAIAEAAEAADRDDIAYLVVRVQRSAPI